ncbi:MAG: TrkH family potassium uptake protein [Oscillospiraceae bacterium]|jgi:trk system potassium uptake protein TrkH|nr:TrkH family potassium uptake protein [Oscillospiraceae bacterium]
MNYRLFARITGQVMCVLAAAMLPSLAAGLYFGETNAAAALAISIAAILAAFVPLALVKPKSKNMYPRDGFVIVSFIWLLFSVFSTLPFLISGEIPSFVDAFFEMCSGYSTTGATIISDVEKISKSLLLFRSFTQWLGGMGILIFVVAILPLSGTRTINLMRAEIAGPTADKLVPLIKHSTRISYIIYFALTLIMFIALLLTGMPAFDSLTNAFATAGTGGFSVVRHGIAAYGDPAAEWIIIIFMILFGINFNLYFLMLRKKFKEVGKNTELRFFLLIIVVSTVLIYLDTMKNYPSVSEGIRTALFQAAAFASTTSFATVDFNLWPSFSKTILLLLMFIGGCAGSTACGLKVSRVILMVKAAKEQLRKMVHPKRVFNIKLDGNVVEREVISLIGSYIIIFLIIFAASFLVISIDGFTFEENFSAVASCINNIGPGFGRIGPYGSFAGFSPLSKIALSLDMLMGRLEIFPIILMFSPSVWKNH